MTFDEAVAASREEIAEFAPNSESLEHVDEMISCGEPTWGISDAYTHLRVDGFRFSAPIRKFWMENLKDCDEDAEYGEWVFREDLLKDGAATMPVEI